MTVASYFSLSVLYTMSWVLLTTSTILMHLKHVSTWITDYFIQIFIQDFTRHCGVHEVNLCDLIKLFI